MKIITFFYLILSINGFIIARPKNILQHRCKKDSDNSTDIYISHNNPFKPRPITPCCSLKLPPPNNENNENNDVKKIINYIIKTFV